ncbi:MAG: response regulator [Opitutaceae bacterium]|jgi:YesN/AraC family two-component response regulator
MPRPANALIVDDEPHVLVLLKGILKQLGIETVWEALDGTEALSKASINKPDVVLLDINLPEVNGLQVLAQLKADHPKMPVIIVSSQGTLKTFDRARELGAAGYVLKFAPKSEILRMLSEVFDEIAAPPVKQTAEGGEAPPKES